MSEDTSSLILCFIMRYWVNIAPDMRKNIGEELSRRTKIHEIRRQDGEILAIYYEP